VKQHAPIILVSSCCSTQKDVIVLGDLLSVVRLCGTVRPVATRVGRFKSMQ